MSVFNQTHPLLKEHLSPMSAYVTDARKRHKRDHNKAWKCEEKRASKEHRKGKGSAGQRHEWSPEDSNDGSAPPNLSDGREKQTQTKPSGLLMWSLITIIFAQFPEK